MFLSEIGRVSRLCQHPKIDATKPIFSPTEPAVLFIKEAAIVFCSNIPCITFLSPHIECDLRVLKRTNKGKVFADMVNSVLKSSAHDQRVLKSNFVSFEVPMSTCIRLQAPCPKKASLGIETPNEAAFL